MMAYYNENDAYAAQWLRNLIKAGHIAPGYVDERDIRDVKPNEIKGFTQCHFFAGIGVWSYALRLAGWPDDKPVWTGSCPCQPFSTAGRGRGTSDERHLWPHWFHLIEQCDPNVVFGEQVASKDGLGWLDLVQTDLEATGYASTAVDMCVAGVGAPHIRQRLYFVAEGLGHTNNTRLEEHGGPDELHLRKPQRPSEVRPNIYASLHGGVADTPSGGRDQSLQSVPEKSPERCRGDCESDGNREPGETNGFWGDADWLRCRDAVWRGVRPGTFPLVDGAPNRVGRLRAYGNAISPQAAQVFIESYLEATHDINS